MADLTGVAAMLQLQTWPGECERASLPSLLELTRAMCHYVSYPAGDREVGPCDGVRGE